MTEEDEENGQVNSSVPITPVYNISLPGRPPCTKYTRGSVDSEQSSITLAQLSPKPSSTIVNRRYMHTGAVPQRPKRRATRLAPPALHVFTGPSDGDVILPFDDGSLAGLI